MQIKYILSEYVENAISEALYDKLEDGTFPVLFPHVKE